MSKRYAILMLSIFIALPTFAAETFEGKPARSVGPLTFEMMGRHFDALRGIDLRDEAGGKVDLASLRGKVVWVNFWAHWCGPCIEEFDSMRVVEKEVGRENLAILLVSSPRDVEKDRAWAKAHQIEWPTLVADTDTAGIARVMMVPARSDLGFPRVPLSSFFDANGTAQLVQPGAPSMLGDSGVLKRGWNVQPWFMQWMRDWRGDS
jgi:thiol-disulfide isomerase/thioredoxin